MIMSSFGTHPAPRAMSGFKSAIRAIPDITSLAGDAFSA
jgi:hypothetical protein